MRRKRITNCDRDDEEEGDGIRLDDKHSALIHRFNNDHQLLLPTSDFEESELSYLLSHHVLGKKMDDQIGKEVVWLLTEKERGEQQKSALLTQLTTLTQHITLLENEGHEEVIKDYIERLHRYNEVKDMGQELLGKLAEIEGTTTRSMYGVYSLHEDD